MERKSSLCCALVVLALVVTAIARPARADGPPADQPLVSLVKAGWTDDKIAEALKLGLSKGKILELPAPLGVGKLLAEKDVEIAAPSLALASEAVAKSLDAVLGRLDAIKGSGRVVMALNSTVVGVAPATLLRTYQWQAKLPNGGFSPWRTTNLGSTLAFHMIHVQLVDAGGGRFKVRARYYEPLLEQPVAAESDIPVEMKAQQAGIYYNSSLHTYGTIQSRVGVQDIASREPLDKFESWLKTNLTALPSGGGAEEILKLFSAVEKGDLDTVKALLQANPGLAKSRKKVVDFYGAREDTPLHQAAMYGNMEIATLLLDAGADVNAPGMNGFTPARYAYYRAQTKMIEFLKSRGGHD